MDTFPPPSPLPFLLPSSFLPLPQCICICFSPPSPSPFVCVCVWEGCTPSYDSLGLYYRSMRRGCGLWCTTPQSLTCLHQGLMTVQVHPLPAASLCMVVKYICVYVCVCVCVCASPVKLWSSNRPQSCFSLPAKANVCCVRFHPTNHYNLAYGSAG